MSKTNAQAPLFCCFLIFEASYFSCEWYDTSVYYKEQTFPSIEKEEKENEKSPLIAEALENKTNQNKQKNQRQFIAVLLTSTVYLNAKNEPLTEDFFLPSNFRDFIYIIL